MGNHRAILYGFVVLIIIVGLIINWKVNPPTEEFMAKEKERLMNQNCKFVLQTGDDYFKFDGLCFQWYDLYENSTTLRNMLKINGG